MKIIYHFSECKKIELNVLKKTWYTFSGIHGNELAGKDLLLELSKHLCEDYEGRPTIAKLINQTRIHVLPLLNPDGAERAVVGDCTSDAGKLNANGVDLVQDFPGSYFMRKLYNF